VDATEGWMGTGSQGRCVGSLPRHPFRDAPSPVHSSVAFTRSEHFAELTGSPHRERSAD